MKKLEVSDISVLGQQRDFTSNAEFVGGQDVFYPVTQQPIEEVMPQVPYHDVPLPVLSDEVMVETGFSDVPSILHEDKDMLLEVPFFDPPVQEVKPPVSGGEPVAVVDGSEGAFVGGSGAADAGYVDNAPMLNDTVISASQGVTLKYNIFWWVLILVLAVGCWLLLKKDKK